MEQTLRKWKECCYKTFVSCDACMLAQLSNLFVHKVFFVRFYFCLKTGSPQATKSTVSRFIFIFFSDALWQLSKIVNYVHSLDFLHQHPSNPSSLPYPNKVYTFLWLFFSWRNGNVNYAGINNVFYRYRDAYCVVFFESLCMFHVFIRW